MKEKLTALFLIAGAILGATYPDLIPLPTAAISIIGALFSASRSRSSFRYIREKFGASKLKAPVHPKLLSCSAASALFWADTH